MKNPFQTKPTFTPEASEPTVATFDLAAFKKAVTTQVRALDNVLDVTLWPLQQQHDESVSKRRIGVGFTGLGNTLAMLGMHYDSPVGRAMAKTIAEAMRDAAYKASVALAVERGAFPLFDAEQYLKPGTFASRLPEDIQDDIRKYGIRNSHLLSIAPTGTVSLAFADNASNGIEPPFSLAYTRKKRNGDGTTTSYDVIDHGFRVYLQTLEADISEPLLEAVCNYQQTFQSPTGEVEIKRFLPTSLVTALELSVDAHLLMMKAVQPYIDSACSKTINCPADIAFGDFKSIYNKAHQYKLKGAATYRPNTILGSVLSVGVEVKKDPLPATTPAPVIVPVLPEVDPLEKPITDRPKGELDSVIKKVCYDGPSGSGSLYVGVSFMKIEQDTLQDAKALTRPIEVFITASQDGVPSEWVAVYARDLSLLARSGLTYLAKALQGARKVKSDKGRVRYGWYHKQDGTEVPRFHDSDVACIAFALQEVLIQRGWIDTEGNVIPFKKRQNLFSEPVDLTDNHSALTKQQVSVVQLSASAHQPSQVGKKCPECGDHTVIKKDGCDFCGNCGYTGSCG